MKIVTKESIIAKESAAILEALDNNVKIIDIYRFLDNKYNTEGKKYFSYNSFWKSLKKITSSNKKQSIEIKSNERKESATNSNEPQQISIMTKSSEDSKAEALKKILGE